MTDKKDKVMPNPAFFNGNEFDVAQGSKKSEDKPTLEKSGYTFAELAIGDDSEHYLKILRRVKHGELIIPSLRAGFFGVNWLIYRRASLIAYPIYLILLMISYKLSTMMGPLPSIVTLLLVLGLPHIFFFFFGNFIYWYSIRKKITDFRARYGDVSAMMYLSEKGGVLKGFSLIAAVLFFQGTVFLVIYSGIYMDVLLSDLWKGFLELAMIKG